MRSWSILHELRKLSSFLSFCTGSMVIWKMVAFMSTYRDFSQLPNILFDLDLLPEDSYVVGFCRFWRHYATRKEDFQGSYRKLARVIRMPKSCVGRMVPEWETAGLVTKTSSDPDAPKKRGSHEEMILSINVDAIWEYNFANYPKCPRLGQVQNSSVPNLDTSVPNWDTTEPIWDTSVPAASSKVRGNTSNTRVISGNKDRLRASTDDATVALQLQIASLQDQLAQALRRIDEIQGKNQEEAPHQGSDRNDVQMIHQDTRLPIAEVTTGNALPDKTGNHNKRPKSEAQKARETEKRAEKKRLQVEEQRRIQALVECFVSLGKRYFEDPDFTVDLGGPRTENYKAGLSIINQATTKGVDDVFLAFWNTPEKDNPNSYWWRDPEHLTFRAFCRGYVNKITSLRFREKNPTLPPPPQNNNRYQRYESPALTYLPPKTGAELRAMTSGV